MLRIVKDPKWTGWAGWFEDENGTMLARLELDGTITPVPDASAHSFHRRTDPAPPEEPVGRDERLLDLKSERKLLGAMLVDPRVSDDLKGLLSGHDVFYMPAHGFVFYAIQEVCEDASKTVTVADVCEVLRDKTHLELVGGYAALLELVKEAAPRSAAQWHAERVAAKAAVRTAVRELGECADKHPDAALQRKRG